MISWLHFGDLHCGDVAGIVSPDYEVPNPAHREVSEQFFSWFYAELKTVGRPDITTWNGDLVEGPGNKQTIELWSSDLDQQRECSEQIVDLVPCSERYFTFGTPYHATSNHNHEQGIADYFDAEIREHWRIEPNGLKSLIRHHIGRSDVPYGQGTQTAKEWVRDALSAQLNEYDPAVFHVRGHCHYYYQIAQHKRWAMSTPCLKLPGGVYGRKLRTQYYDVGFMEYRIDRQGWPTVIPHIMPIQICQKEEYLCLTKENGQLVVS